MWFRLKEFHPLSHVTHWSRNHVTCKKSFISTFVRVMATNFSKVWIKLSWPQPSSHVTHYHVTNLYSQKGASPVSQRQWPSNSNLVGLKVRVKRPHLFLQVTCWSRDHVLFEKRYVSTNARPQNSAGGNKLKKLTNQKQLIHIDYTTFKISKLSR